MSTAADNYKVSDYDYVTSSIGNAVFSGLSMEQLWSCVSLSSTREELDAAVKATSDLIKLLKS